MKATALALAGDVARFVPVDIARMFSFIASPRVRANPWGLYRHLHENGPVRPAPDGTWIVASHAGMSDVLRHPNTSVDESLAVSREDEDRSGPFNDLMDRSLLFTDPPEHHRLRRLVSRSFTPARIEALRTSVQEQTEDRLEKLRPRGEADLLAEFARPYPVAVISELLGIPHEDRDVFLGWASDVAPAVDVDLFRTEEVEQRAEVAAANLAEYLGSLLDDPSRRDPEGLIAAVAHVPEDDEQLDRDEIVALCGLLLVAGFETTMNLICNGVESLLRHPDQLDLLRRGEVPMESAVEELLRFCGPIQFTQRVVLEDTEIEGHPVPARTLVALLIGAANRDPLVFDQPDRLDLRRDPNPHLSFSFGIHHCLGAPLARLEAAVALRAILDRLPDLELIGRPRWRETFVVRGVTSLPVRWST